MPVSPTPDKRASSPPLPPSKAGRIAKSSTHCWDTRDSTPPRSTPKWASRPCPTHTSANIHAGKIDLRLRKPRRVFVLPAFVTTTLKRVAGQIAIRLKRKGDIISINLNLCDDQELVHNFMELERVLRNILLENVNNVNKARLLRNCNSLDQQSEWKKYRSYVLENYEIQDGNGGLPTE